jgi:hypothetical protein
MNSEPSTTMTFEIPQRLADQIQTFAEIGGLSTGQALKVLLPHMESLLASPDEILGLLESEFEFSGAEIAAIDQRLAAFQEG